MLKNLLLFLTVTTISFNQLNATETLTLQQGLNEYMGCQDIHIGNGDNNEFSGYNDSKHPVLYTEAILG